MDPSPRANREATASTMPPSTPLRRALLDLADRLDAVPLTLVAAPAGSGKTTLLGAWREQLAARDVPSAFLDLGPLHAHGPILLADLVAAIRSARPGFGAESERTLAQLGEGDDWRLLARAFQRDRAADPHLLVVVLDNFHELGAETAGARLVDEWLRALIPNLHWVIATRGGTPAVTARLRAADAVLEVDTDALSLRSEEVQQVLAARGVAPEPELVARLLARTGGWATGVQVAARRLAALPEGERAGYLERLAREPDLFGFLTAEVLRDQPDGLRDAVEIVALAGGACTPAEVAELTGDPRTPEWIARAVDHGILTSDGDIVHTHQLWRDLLCEQARARHGPGPYRALRARTAGLLRRRGRHDEALEAFTEAQDWPAAAATLREVAQSWLRAGRGERLRHWLERLPPALVEGDPALLTLLGVTSLRSAPARSLPLLARAADAWRARGNRTRERQLLGLLGLLHAAALQREEALRILRRVISLRGMLSDPAERGTLLVLLAGRRLLTGRFASALTLSERAAARPLDAIPLFLNSLNLGVLRGVRGEWELGLAALRTGLAQVDLAAQPLAHWSLRLLEAQTLARSGALEEAARALARVEEAAAEHRIALLQELVTQELAFVAARRGDAEQARQWLDAGRARARGGAAEAVMRAAAALEEVRAGRLAEAARDATRSLELVRARGEPVLAMAPWWTCFALWALGRAGDPAEAWRAARVQRRHFAQPALRLAHHAMQVALADLAARAGDVEEARRIALEAFAFAERAGLQEPDPWVGDLAGPAAAELALRGGAGPGAALARLAASTPDRVDALLAELRADARPAERLRAVSLLAARGGRASFEPLRAAAQDPDPQVAAAARAALPALDLRPAYELRVVSLGGLAVLRGEAPIGAEDWKGQTARRLFARLLIAEGRPVTRERLLADLWPEAEPAAARNSLRVAIARLNDALDPERPAGTPPWFVLAEDETLRLRPEVIARWDVVQFRARLAEAADAERRGDVTASLAAERAALALYGGPLLSDLHADWIDPLRRELAARFAAAAHRAGPRLVRRGRLDEALELAARLLRADPADEQAFALRMRAQLAGHDRAGALRTFAEAEATLARELQLAPGEELRRLAAQARGGG